MKPNNRWIMPLCIGIMLVVSLVLYPSLPDEMPTHWGINGEVNGTTPKAIAIFIMPALALMIYALTYIVPRIDPRRDSYAKFAPSYERLRMALVVFMMALHIVVLTQYDNPDGITRLIMVAVSLLFVIIGNEIGRFRQTWFTGIRTPWTLADERVWKITHRVGARWFVGVGVLNMIASLVLPLPIIFVMFLVTALGLTFGLMAYSYVVYQRINNI